MQLIHTKGLKNELEKGSAFTLVDIRPPARYAEKHISGAVNVPALDNFSAGLANAVAARDTAVVLYGEHEEDDAQVALIGEQAEKLGYAKVYGLQGGILKWMEDGGLVEGGQES